MLHCLVSWLATPLEKAGDTDFGDMVFKVGLHMMEVCSTYWTWLPVPDASLTGFALIGVTTVWNRSFEIGVSQQLYLIKFKLFTYRYIYTNRTKHVTVAPYLSCIQGRLLTCFLEDRSSFSWFVVTISTLYFWSHGSNFKVTTVTRKKGGPKKEGKLYF